MQIAVVGAGFTPEEADQLRRSLASFRRMGTIGAFRDKFIAGMLGNGYARSLRSAVSTRSRALPITAFPKATRRPLPCWSMSRPG